LKRALLRNGLLKNSRGLSGVIASIFIMLVIVLIYFNVFIYVLSRYTSYQEIVSSVSQDELERLYERLTVSDVNYTVEEGIVHVEGTVRNEGTLPVQLVVLWLLDSTINEYGYNDTISISLKPNESFQFGGSKALKVALEDASSNHNFSAWFVTSRGNLVPFQQTSRIIVANLAQGIGAVAMDFSSFRYYLTENMDEPIFSFTVPAREKTVFAVYLTNLDPTHEVINLTGYSCIWARPPYSSESQYWPITKVENGTIEDFDYLLLEYGKPTLVYFGPNKADRLAGDVTAVSILLHGKIGSSDYGQNIPFISIYFSP